MTVIEVRNSGGLVARCDDKCHMALGPDCDCMCGGRYHGKGRTGELVDQLQADGASLVQRLAREAGGTVPAETIEALTLPIFGRSP